MKAKRIKKGRKIAAPSFWIPAGILVALTLFFYLPLWRNGFVTWDDPIAITENIYLRSLNWDSLKWMFTTFLTGNWIPLTWLSLTLDYQVFGLDPQMFHFVNLVFHIVNSVLVFNFCRRFLAAVSKDERVNDLAAFLTALLFALHPLHVESVAWATERKDVLCSFFYLSALTLYWNYASAKVKEPIRLWGCGGLFILALMSKPMAITLPAVFLLLDFWPLKRWTRGGFWWAFLEKVPFFVVGLVFGLVTLASQASAHAFGMASSLTMTFRVMNAFRTLVLYVWKMILPLGLVPFYPVPRTADDLYYFENDAALVLVLGLLIAAWFLRKKTPAFLTALGFYLITLVPVIGIIQYGSQSMADRYTYLPSLAFFLPLSWGVMTLLSGRTWSRSIFIGVLALVLGCLTWNQLGVWRDSISFWECVTRNFPGQSQLAHNNLGDAYRQAGRVDEALAQYDQALALPPIEAFTHTGKGRALLDKGLLDDAIIEFKKALELDPSSALPHEELWFIYRKKGLKPQALDEIQRAVALDPQSVEIWNDMGISDGETGRLGLAEQAFQKALSLDPNNFQAQLNLAMTYQQQKRWVLAVEGYEKTTVLAPNSATAWYDLGSSYLETGNLSAALSALQKADQLAPGQAIVEQKQREVRSRMIDIPSKKR